MEKSIVYGGLVFKPNKSIRHKRAMYGDIFQAYERPSNKKVKEYYWWKNWAENHNACGFGISSKTCQFFTLTMSVKFGPKTYKLFITPTYNYYCEL